MPLVHSARNIPSFLKGSHRVLEKMRCLKNIAEFPLRPRIATVCRGPAQRRFNTNSNRGAQNSLDSSSLKETVNRKGFTIVVAVVAGLAIYYRTPGKIFHR